MNAIDKEFKIVTDVLCWVGYVLLALAAITPLLALVIWLWDPFWKMLVAAVIWYSFVAWRNWT